MPDNIVFSADPASDLRRFLEENKYSKLLVLADENTDRLCYPAIRDVLPSHTLHRIASGEAQKNIQTCISIWQRMTDEKLDRHSALIVLGGGVLGDMGGFCAATYKRGIDFLLIPTTLLSQVDASIGGKLGIDFNHFKNHIGVFQLPVFTLLSDLFLETLPEAELRSGFAEVIKHALISDERMWHEMKSKTIGNQDWQKLIRHSVAFKSGVVSKDPREQGLRKILNAGHTIGHAIESFLLNAGEKIKHGDAIAAGLIMEGFIAHQHGLLDKQSLADVVSFIRGVFGKLELKQAHDETIIALAAQDKKNKGDRILCVLLDGIGKAKWDCDITPDEIRGALAYYRSI
jgi:3-dehydroquinate synthase